MVPQEPVHYISTYRYYSKIDAKLYVFLHFHPKNDVILQFVWKWTL